MEIKNKLKLSFNIDFESRLVLFFGYVIFIGFGLGAILNILWLLNGRFYSALEKSNELLILKDRVAVEAVDSQRLQGLIGRMRLKVDTEKSPIIRNPF
jgi:hypothetical protein